MKQELHKLKNPIDRKSKDQLERIGEKMRICQENIELFKTSLLRDMR